MFCLFGHDYQKTDKRIMVRSSLIDIEGVGVLCIIFHCSKCGKRKVVEA